VEDSIAVDYEYYKPGPTSPDLTAILVAVRASAMVDPCIDYCRWDEFPDGLLQCFFLRVLSEPDKALLDSIVEQF
jgi:hypothetical protein